MLVIGLMEWPVLRHWRHAGAAGVRAATCSQGQYFRDSQGFTSSFLLLVVMPGATSSVLAPSRNALVTSSFLLLVSF